MNFDIFHSEIFKDINSTKFGASFVFAFSVGYLLKKSIKLMLFVLLVGVLALFWLDDSSVVEMQNYVFSSSLGRIVELFNIFGNFIYDKVANIDQPSGIGLVAGFLLGLKFG